MLDINSVAGEAEYARWTALIEQQTVEEKVGSKMAFSDAVRFIVRHGHSEGRPIDDIRREAAEAVNIHVEDSHNPAVTREEANAMLDSELDRLERAAFLRADPVSVDSSLSTGVFFL